MKEHFRDRREKFNNKPITFSRRNIVYLTLTYNQIIDS